MTDIVKRLMDLHRQAVEDNSHYYVGECVRDAIAEIRELRKEVAKWKDACERRYLAKDPRKGRADG
jgi:hypothetical protein